VLVVAPWSAFWHQNFFTQGAMFGVWMSNPFVRGAVSGIGVITVAAGLAELASAFRMRRRNSMSEGPNIT
jgi:hypothetical protein